MQNCIVLDRVSKTYGHRVNALKDISFSFCVGTCYAVVGLSGSGKSTLLNIIGMLDKPTSGCVHIMGINTTDATQRIRAELRNRQVGFVFQAFMLSPKLTACENVMLPMLPQSISYSDCKHRAVELLDSVGLSDRADHFPFELSGGEQQRVAVSRALANSPQLILADEPTGNLDEQNSELVFRLLADLAKRGHCVVIVTHHEKPQQLADVVIRLQGGQIVDVMEQ